MAYPIWLGDAGRRGLPDEGPRSAVSASVFALWTPFLATGKRQVSTCRLQGRQLSQSFRSVTTAGPTLSGLASE